MDKLETARKVRECGERMARFVELGASDRLIYRELLILARLLDEVHFSHHQPVVKPFSTVSHYSP